MLLLQSFEFVYADLQDDPHDSCHNNHRIKKHIKIDFGHQHACKHCQNSLPQDSSSNDIISLMVVKGELKL